MAITYKYIDQPRTFDEGANYLEHEIYPMLQDFWKLHGEKFYKQPLWFNAPAFVNLWALNGLALVIAYEDKTPVGLFIGIKFTPMLFQETILEVETLFGRDRTIEQGLLDYVASITNIMGITQIHVHGDMNDASMTPQGWKYRDRYHVTCFERE